MSTVPITVNVPLDTLAAFSSGDGLNHALEAVVTLVWERLDSHALPDTVAQTAAYNFVAANTSKHTFGKYLVGASGGGIVDRAEFARASGDPQIELIDVVVKTLTGKSTTVKIPNTLR